MTTELVLDGNFRNDESVWDAIEWERETVTVPDGYSVQQAGDDVMVIRLADESVCHCVIIDSDFVID